MKVVRLKIDKVVETISTIGNCNRVDDIVTIDFLVLNTVICIDL